MKTTTATAGKTLWTALFLLVATAAPAVSQDKGDKDKAKQGKVKVAKEEKPEPHAVIKVDDEIRVVKQSAVKTAKAEIEQNYKRALKEYTEAVKEAKKNKTKVATEKPKKSKFKLLKSNCKGEEVAKQFVAKLEAAEQKKRDAKAKTETKKPPIK